MESMTYVLGWEGGTKASTFVSLMFLPLPLPCLGTREACLGTREACLGPREACLGPTEAKILVRVWVRVRGRPEAKILIFSKSLQEPLGGSGDPPGAAGGCRELPGASGGFREPPGPISGSGKVPEKIKSGLNRHFCQQLAAILIPRAPVVPPGLWTRKN